MFSKRTNTFNQNAAQIAFQAEQKTEALLQEYIKEYKLREELGINSIKQRTAFLGPHLSLNSSLSNYSRDDLKENIIFLEQYLNTIKKAPTDICALDTAINQYNKVMGEAGFKGININRNGLEISLNKILTTEVRHLLMKTKDQLNTYLASHNTTMCHTHNTL